MYIMTILKREAVNAILNTSRKTASTVFFAEAALLYVFRIAFPASLLPCDGLKLDICEVILDHGGSQKGIGIIGSIQEQHQPAVSITIEYLDCAARVCFAPFEGGAEYEPRGEIFRKNHGGVGQLGVLFFAQCSLEVEDFH